MKIIVFIILFVFFDAIIDFFDSVANFKTFFYH